MTTAHDSNYIETKTSQQPFSDKPKSSKLSWEDFSMFYKTANDWDYPVNDDTKNAESNSNLTSNDDMFKNHGSHHSMDILADEMNTKWSYNLNNNENTINKNNIQSLPDDTTPWNQTLSNTAQTSITMSAQQRMENFLDEEEDEVPLVKGTSITDSQGIDISEDTNIIINEVESQMKKQNIKRDSIDNKDEEIKMLKEVIDKLQNENKNLIQENAQFKKRNGELRKTLHKAQKYRRKSSIAVQNLIKINNDISTLQHGNQSIDNNNNNEEKVREEEELNNIKIQEQIQQAISMFQDEFGAELDEELNNIESFQYESLPDESGSEDENNTFQFQAKNNEINNNFFNNATNMQHNNTPMDTPVNNNSDSNNFTRFQPITNGMNFAIKFTDANSNKNNDKTHHNNQFIDDDALPGSYTTPGGPSEYVTPGGPEMDMKVENVNNDRLKSSNMNDTKFKEMESRLNDLSDKMLGLMERIQDLTDKNQHLEVSKLALITNTCNAMNLYRDTIKRLSKENQILLNKIKAV
eukprot:187140_1